jgi:L-iditol 2-dehydrogenase
MYYNNSDVRLEEVPLPEINDDELLVKIIASGICGSDVLEWYRIKKAPIVLGHEVAGIVEKAGANVKDFKPGDRVVVSHHIPCNTCRYCLAGNHTVCETLQTTNFDPGGFCEYIRVPKLNTEIGTFLLPENISFEDGSFCEALACVVRGQRKANFKSGQTVLVMGSGISGLLHIMLAKAGGAEKVIATDIDEFKMQQARECGADEVFAATEDIPARVMECNDGRGVDLIIVCTGALSAFEQAMDCIDRAGTVMCFATTTPEARLPVPLNRFWRSLVTITSSYANDPDDLREAMDLIGSGKIDVNKMITHRFPLAETQEGFKLMTTPNNSLKIIIEPQE